MADSEILVQDPRSGIAPRHVNRVNVVGFLTLVRKECARFMSVYLQTVVTPLISTLLYYAIFAMAFGGATRRIDGIPYLEFLAPGLVMMSMIQNAFANTSSSIMISKVQGNIVDILMAPLSAFEILLAYALSGVVRGVVVGLACVPAILVFCPIHLHSIPAVLAFGLLGCLMLSIIGVAAGLWSAKYDHLASITNFVVLPLTFLSGTFYSMHSLPPFWQNMAHMNPFYFMIDGFRYGFTGNAETSILNGILMLLEMNVALFIFTYGLLLTGYKTKS